MHYAVPRIFAAAGWLERFYTDLWVSKRLVAVVERTLPRRVQPVRVKRLLARRVEGVPESKVTAFPCLGFAYGLRLATARNHTARAAVNLWASTLFCKEILSRGLGNANAVYAFNSAGLELLRHARARGLFTVIEQTIAPRSVEAAIMRQEAECWPGWEEEGNDPYAWALAEREEAEWREADLILCGSEFVRDAIGQVNGPRERCRVVPYGVELPLFRPRSVLEEKRLRVLFIGTVGLRKGVQYLGRAAAKLGKENYEFRVVGPVRLTPFGLQSLRHWGNVVGPVPRSQVAEELGWADVFVFPSLCEGSATVCYEALAAGLPVITTPNAGSVVRDGVDGFIVPIRDVDALVSRIEQLAAQPELRRWMSDQARQRALEFTVERYGERLLAALSS
ncbi:MAG: glycosyltransferase family 4 protein [Candidatus Tectomicrobia bacterium]|nr:glycosyltransferase family 4 protein [Candidatus Tectomicrobia bacterium]